MVKIEVNNFQSIEHVVLTVDGFTALAGRSGLGKSALLRAVEAALGGASGATFVRHGAHCAKRLKDVKTCKCFASVHITADGLDLLWEKGDCVNRYVYNGVNYDAVARGFPEFLRTNFGPVKIGDKQTLLQVAPQWEPLFLLNTSGGVAADVLSDVAHLNRINVALTLSEKDRREASASHKARLKDVATKELELQGYNGLDTVLAQVQAVVTRTGAINALEGEVQAIEAHLAALRTVVARVRTLLVVETVTVPVQSALVGYAKALHSLQVFCANLNTRASAIKAMSSVEKISAPDLCGVQAVTTKHRKITVWTEKTQALEHGLLAWQGVEIVTLPAKPAFREPLTKLNTLAIYAQKQQTLGAQLRRLEEACAQAEQDEKHSLEDIRALGVCPTCTRPFEAGCQC